MFLPWSWKSTCCLLATTSFANAWNTTNPSSVSAAQNATAFALTYGYPLLPYKALVDKILPLVGVNALYNEPGVATSAEAAVVRPNDDTIYSLILIDLSRQDVVVTVPEVPDGRFYVFPFYDVFGNNFANIGSVNASLPGKYLLRLATGLCGYETNDSASIRSIDGLDTYRGIINFPTTYGVSLPRILLLNNNSDISNVQSIQSHISISTIPKTGRPSNAPPLTSSLFNVSGSQEEQILTLTARIAPYNPPIIPSDTISVNNMLSIAGIHHGTYTPPQNINLTLANLASTSAIGSAISADLLFLNENWTTISISSSGNFGNNYGVRAYIADIGYLMLAAYEALYPTYRNSSSSTEYFVLEPNQSLLFTFSGKPPVTGFWSLTAYNTSGYLIPNDLDVYSLGDRSSLVYPSGNLIYGNSNASRSGEDEGEFQILMQPADVSPPSNWTSNWLPAPPGGGEFSATLRWYGPEDALTNGTYQYPVITKQDAIAVAES